MINRVIGLILAFLGILMLKYFPGVSVHQKSGMTFSGILIAVLMILIGIGLILFG